jgi:hypothetical protein
MVRPDTSDSSTKAIHLGSRKAVDIWNKRRNRGENLSEKFTNILLQEDEKEQAANNNGENLEEQENRIRPPRLDLYFAADSKQYKNMTKWRRYFTYTKPEDIAADYDMLEYSLRMLRPRASRYKEQQEAEKLRLYKEERMRKWEEEKKKKEAAQAAEVLPPPPPPPAPPPTEPLTPEQRVDYMESLPSVDEQTKYMERLPSHEQSQMWLVKRRREQEQQQQQQLQQEIA